MFDYWSDDEIRKWLSFHQTDRGHLSIGSTGPISSAPDIWLGIAFAIVVIVGLIVTGFAGLANVLWQPTHFSSLAFFEIWPLGLLAVFLMISVGSRLETIRQYYLLKRILAERNAV